jgi:hypothetical protein
MLHINQITLMYPDKIITLQMYVGHDVTKEEACKVAEGIILAPSEELADGTVISPYNWSDYEDAMAENSADDTALESIDTDSTQL